MHKEIFGSKFVSFERIKLMSLILNVLALIWRKTRNEQAQKKRPFDFKWTTFTMQ